MKNRRLLFRVILKTLSFLGVVILLLVFFNSLLTTNETLNVEANVAQVVLEIDQMQRGQIKKTRWNGVEVAVLYRHNPEIVSIQQSTVSEQNLPRSLQTSTRSEKAEYFVYINAGDSGNCPLFYSQGIFKDICTANKFDENGRAYSDGQQKYTIQVPPHYFINKKVVFGSWRK